MSPETAQQRRDSAVAQFLQDAGDTFFAGTNNCNARWINGFLEQQQVPVTLRNLQIAHRFLSDTNRLEKPFDNQYTIHPVPDKPGQAQKYKGTEHNVKKILSTVVIRHSPLGPAERQLIGERPERMDEIGGEKLRAFAAERQRLNQSSPIGQPVSPSLKAEYRKSLADEHNRQGLPRRWAEARCVIALNFPEVKRDSQRFNELVAAEVARVS